jgi:hypothetical protein
MITLLDLWLPILLAAVIVFVVSAIVHTALPWHKGEFKRLDAEDDFLDALRRFDLPPGDYAAPMPHTPAEANSAEHKAKVARGPRVMLTVIPPSHTMARSLIGWFVYLIVVSSFAAAVACSMLGPGTDYLFVFHTTAVVAFAGYALAIWQSWIWYSRSTGYAIRTTIDGLVYALLTGGVFGWLWP